MDPERDDYGDQPRVGHKPTLSELARSAEDDRAGGRSPARTRFPFTSVAVLALGGVGIAAVLVLGSRLAADRLPETWGKVAVGLACLAIIQVSTALARRLNRRAEPSPPAG
jgi:hypothetical protein